MKKIIHLLSVVLMCLSLIGCGSKSNTSSAGQGSAPKSSFTPGSVLVVFFSRAGEQYNVGVIKKGNTAIVAEMIADCTGADLYEVRPEKESNYDVGYEKLTEIGLQEKRDKARPEIAGTLPDLSKYDTIFFGTPVWWEDWPMIMYTFFENNKLSGKKLIPFVTHAGSGMCGLDQKLAAVYPNCELLTGIAIVGEQAQKDPGPVKETVNNWLENLGF